MQTMSNYNFLFQAPDCYMYILLGDEIAILQVFSSQLTIHQLEEILLKRDHSISFFFSLSSPLLRMKPAAFVLVKKQSNSFW